QLAGLGPRRTGHPAAVRSRPRARGRPVRGRPRRPAGAVCRPHRGPERRAAGAPRRTHSSSAGGGTPMTSTLGRLLWVRALVWAASLLSVPFLFGWVRWLGPFAVPPGAPSDDTRAEEGVVCYGIVDLKDGVMSLVPLHAGRVVEVLVREDQVVSEGTPLVR